ncbi:MAG: cysteine synthase family protein, partial [Candidatus Bathyarchaeota archaeon]|nr:cysteine synthase family protein [Candidatus Bathyarchaeota archaeon]
MVYRNLIDAIGNTPIVELGRLSPRPGVRLFAKLEGQNPAGSLKDRVAKYMLEAAERSGELTPDRIVLEATSGNTGIALAMVCLIKGYRVVAVMPDNMSEERSMLLRAFGAEVVYSEGAKGTNGSILLAEEMAARDPTYFMPNQFGNPANPLAHYETTGPEILRDLPEIDVFVAGLGTGGTLTGVGRYLKEHRPGVKVVACVPLPGDLVQGLRSLDEGFIPDVFDESVIDRKVLVDSESAFAGARELAEQE